MCTTYPPGPRGLFTTHYTRPARFIRSLRPALLTPQHINPYHKLLGVNLLSREDRAQRANVMSEVGEG